MSLRLSELAEAEERRAGIRDAAALFLRGEWSLERLRKRVEGEGFVDAPDLWVGMQALDWDQVEASGTPSESLGVDDFCTIVEETGRALAPTPLVPCVVARTILRGASAAPEASLPVLAQREPKRTSDRFATDVRVTQTDEGFRLEGTKRFVAYGAQADLLIVPALQGGGELTLFAVDPAVEGVHLEALDLLDGFPCAELRLEQASVPRDAVLAAGEAASRLLREALELETLARCAELVGVAARALELAVEYARQRIAFDRPIGSFQAVQHRLVNLRGMIEIARALVQGAAGPRSEGDDQRSVAVAMAAFAALDDLRKVPEGALQVFGGIGYTWEHDIHFFVRRAATLCALLGERSEFREEVARHLEAAT